MKTDRELLELAAKAARIDAVELGGWTGLVRFAESAHPVSWNPLTDDGDALRLAVKLRIVPACGDEHASVYSETLGAKWCLENRFPVNGDPYAATRVAITRAAAAIGEGMAQSAGPTELPEDNYYKSQAEAEESGRAAAIGEAMP